MKTWCLGVGTPLRELSKKAFYHPTVERTPIKEELDAVEKLQKRWKVRCPICGRRLHPKKTYIGIEEREFRGFVIPQHKAA